MSDVAVVRARVERILTELPEGQVMFIRMICDGCGAAVEVKSDDVDVLCGALGGWRVSKFPRWAPGVVAGDDYCPRCVAGVPL